MKRIICTVLSLIVSFNLFGTQAFAAKDKTVKTGLKAEKISSFNINSSDKVTLAATKTPVIAIEEKDGAIRFVDANGKNINEETYDAVDAGYGYAELWHDLGQQDLMIVGKATETKDVYKSGLIGTDGTEYFPCEFDEIFLVDEELLVLTKVSGEDDKFTVEEISFFNILSKEVYSIELPEEVVGVAREEYSIDCNLSEDGYIQFYGEVDYDKNHLFIYNPEGELVFSEIDNYELDLYPRISNYWDYSGFFSIGDAFYDDNGELITITSAVINSVEKEWGLIEFYDSGYGLMDMEENIVCEPYDLIIFSGENGYVEKDEKYGLINNKGELLTELIYDGIKVAENGFATAMKGELVGFINNEGKEITDFIFDAECKSWTFTEYGNCLVLKDGKLGMIDKAGKYIFKPELDEENVHYDQDNGYIKENVAEQETLYTRNGATVTAKNIIRVDNNDYQYNPDLYEINDKNKVSLVDYGGNVLVKGGQNSEYVAYWSSDYVLGLAGKTVNVYELTSK